MSPFRALVVDYGGVLTTPLQHAMAAFADEMGIEFSELVRVCLAAYTGGDDPLVVAFETGKISEEEFTHEFAARLQTVCGRPIEADRLVARLFAGVRLEDRMLDAVAAARRAGVKTGLLSNSWGMGLYPIERLGPLFDAVVISGEVGLRKPDPQIFVLATERLGVDATDCVFVDDHSGHLDVARALGMTTVLHRGPEQTIAELQELLARSLGPSDR